MMTANVLRIGASSEEVSSIFDERSLKEGEEIVMVTLNTPNNLKSMAKTVSKNNVPGSSEQVQSIKTLEEMEFSDLSESHCDKLHEMLREFTTM